MTIQDAAFELGISLRQAYRDLSRGLKGVAAILRSRYSVHLARSAKWRAGIQTQSETMDLEYLETHPCRINLVTLLESAIETVKPKAARFGIILDSCSPQRPIWILADPSVGRQVLISVISYAVNRSQSRKLTISLTTTGPDDREAVVTLSYVCSSASPGGFSLDSAVVCLMGVLEWSLDQQAMHEEECITIRARIPRSVVLVIDDNEGMSNLIERFLSEEACKVLSVTNAEEGLRLASELLPDAIVLDILMPGIDGWELLQRLRTQTCTCTIPVIVCSIFDDAELAYALGASFFCTSPSVGLSLLLRCETWEFYSTAWKCCVLAVTWFQCRNHSSKTMEHLYRAKSPWTTDEKLVTCLSQNVIYPVGRRH